MNKQKIKVRYLKVGVVDVGELENRESENRESENRESDEARRNKMLSFQILAQKSKEIDEMLKGDKDDENRDKSSNEGNF